MSEKRARERRQIKRAEQRAAAELVEKLSSQGFAIRSRYGGENATRAALGLPVLSIFDRVRRFFARMRAGERF